MKGRRRKLLFFVALIISIGFFSSIFTLSPHLLSDLREKWKALTQESKRILGWNGDETSQEEKRIREEVILKKMEEASVRQDWRTLAPEYPRPKKLEFPTPKEKIEAFKGTPEFEKMDREVKEYLRKKEELYYPEPPIPSMREATDLIPLRDGGTEKVIERLLSSKEKESHERPLEENLRLGMKGPLVSRKILERPHPPPVKLKIEVEIEMTLWVLPDGKVDRVIPSIKGDVELERVAIQYLKQWRFAPLPKDQPQIEQWGTLPIKFKLQ